MADSASNKSNQIVAEQRDIQHVVDIESENGAASSAGATQAGARRYPEPPFPKQHQPKPGEETQLDPRQCMMHLITAAQASCRIRSRS